MAELLPENYKDLLNYHVALKQFLGMSSGISKLNTTRAAKARDKLLRLSASQFFELSTDVYDELQRRIDESSDEPDFLLPKSSFHPKRNEARKKLGSLQQTRFRDLVSDILYEIERRGFHKKENFEKLFPPTLTSTTTTTSPTHDTTHVPVSTLSVSGQTRSSHPHDSSKQAVVSLQSTTVIPTEANMAWSSDEEDEDEKKDKFDSNTNHVSQQINDQRRRSESSQRQSLSNSLNTSYSSSNSNNSFQRSSKGTDNSSSSGKRNSSNSDSNVGIASGVSINDAAAKPSPISRGLSLSKARPNKDRDIELLIEEGTKMDQKITSLEQGINHLEQKNALLISKSDRFQSEAEELSKINESLKSKINSLESQLIEKNQEVKDLTRKVNAFILKEKDSESQQRSLNIHQNTANVIDEEQVPKLTQEIDVLKSKLEAFRSKKSGDLVQLDSSFTEVSNSNFDKNGLIPSNLFILFRQSVQDYLIKLNENYKLTSRIDSSLIFHLIAKISDSATKISNYSPHSEKSELIRAAISHAITSTRYYAIYGDLLPKLVVESSISEIVFAVFDFISDVKIVSVNEGFDYSKAHSGFENISNGSHTETSEDPPSVSPVRPLRMAKKIAESNDIESYKKPLNLTINPAVANASEKSINTVTSTPSESPLAVTKNTNRSFNTVTPLKSGFPSVVSRYSPESNKNTAAGSGLRKSSSGNILSKVKQFEQQDSEAAAAAAALSKTPSPIAKKQIVSPLSQVNASKLGRGASVSDPVEVNERSDIKPNKEISNFNGRSSNEQILNSALNIARPDAEVEAEVNNVNASNNFSSNFHEGKQEGGSELNLAPAATIRETSNNQTLIGERFSNYAPVKDSISQNTGNVATQKVNGDVSKDLNNPVERNFTAEPLQATAKPASNITGGSIFSLKNFGIGKKSEPVEETTKLDESSEPFVKGPGTRNVNGAPLETSIGVIDNGNFSPNDAPKSNETKLNTLSHETIATGSSDFNLIDSLKAKLVNNSSPTKDSDGVETGSKGGSSSYGGDRDLQIRKNNAHGLQNSSRPIAEEPESLEFNKNIGRETYQDPEDDLNQLSSDYEFNSRQLKKEIISSSAKDVNGEEDIVIRKHSIKKVDVPSSTKNIPKGPSLVETKPTAKALAGESDNEIIKNEKESEDDDDDDDTDGEEEDRTEIRRNRSTDKHDDEDFDIEDFDIEDPDNTLSELLLYLEHQTVKVISTIQSLLIDIKTADSTKGELRKGSKAIDDVVFQMVEATSNSMNQSRNIQLKEHGSWVVDTLSNAGRRMRVLCKSNEDGNDDEEYADKQFKQRLAGIAFDVAKCTKELVKTVEEANLKEEIEHLNKKLDK